MPRPAASTTASRARRRSGALLAGLSIAAGVLAACASTPSSDEVVDALQRAGLSEAEATCAADALYRNLDDDQIGAIAERGPSAVVDDPDDPDEPIDVARREIAACRSTTTTTTLGPGTSLPKEPLGTPTTVRPAD